MAIASHMPAIPNGKTYVLAIGKAAAAMAQAFEARWPLAAPLQGLAITRYGHGCECQRIRVIEASHPVPDMVGQLAAQQALNEVMALKNEDLFVCLISGGGSSLLSLPAPTVSLADKQTVNRLLLRSGLAIDQMNCVRKHLSAVKGGKLALAAQPAQTHTIAISDVPGNALSVIASGPTVPDETTRQQALDICLNLPGTPDDVIDWLGTKESETPKGNDFTGNHHAVVAITPEDCFTALIDNLANEELATIYLGADIEGEAKEIAKAHAKQALELAQALSKPTLILSGGETSVTMNSASNKSRGGRNTEYLLSLFIELKGHPQIFALAADTDGIDGSEDNAGAFFGPQDWQRAKAQQLSPDAALDAHDSYGFFQKLTTLLVTGPTRTNINDFRAILIQPAS